MYIYEPRFSAYIVEHEDKFVLRLSRVSSYPEVLKALQKRNMLGCLNGALIQPHSNHPNPISSLWYLIKNEEKKE